MTEKQATDNSPKLHIPEKLEQRYELCETLADSARGHVLKVCSRENGKIYTARCVSADDDSARKEYELLCSLSWKGIPKAAELIEDEQTSCVVREFINGTPLDEYATSRRLTELEIIKICTGVCDILSYIHSRKPAVIHRDVKPQNIIIQEDGTPALIDFADARTQGRDALCDTNIAGTSFFAPPEQYGFSQTDQRSDLYAFGVLARWLLTGRVAKGGDIDNYVLRNMIRRCTRFAPDDRFPNTASVKRQLRRAQRVRNISARQRFLTIIMLMLAVFTVSTAVSGAMLLSAPRTRVIPVSSSDVSETSESFLNDIIAGKAEPKIVVKTERRDGDWRLDITCSGDFYIDWGDEVQAVTGVAGTKEYIHSVTKDEVAVYSPDDITGFYCWSNYIWMLDVSRCPELERLQLDDNLVGELDLRNNPRLVELTCPYNQINKLLIPREQPMETLVCNDNALRFSTLPIIDSLDGGMYPAQNQQGLRPPMLVEANHSLDLSAEAFVDGTPSVFVWYADDELIEPEEREPGVFFMGEEYIGKNCRCEITNDRFPMLVLEEGNYMIIKERINREG